MSELKKDRDVTSPSTFKPNRVGKARLLQEYKCIHDLPMTVDKHESIYARPLESDIFTWYYILIGPPDTPYYKGIYFGKIQFTSEYPLRAPTITMITPNGRFTTESNLCLSMTNGGIFRWNPVWNIMTILQAVLSFMTGDEYNHNSLNSTDMIRHQYATKSMDFNLKNPIFMELFEDRLSVLKDIHAQIPSIYSSTSISPSSSPSLVGIQTVIKKEEIGMIGVLIVGLLILYICHIQKIPLDQFYYSLFRKTS